MLIGRGVFISSGNFITVSIILPAPGTYDSDQHVILQATADDEAGTITSVEFFEGTNSIGFAVNTIGNTWELVWWAPLDSFSITAKATNTYNKFTISDPINVTYSADVYGALVYSNVPVSYWRLNESNGSIVHDSMGTNDGSFVNDVIINQTSIVTDSNGPCALFNTVGADGHAGNTNEAAPIYEAINNTYLADFSIEAWIHPTAWPADSYHVIYEERNSVFTSGVIAMHINNSSKKIEVDINPNNLNLLLASTSVIELNTTYHIVYKYIASQNREEMWINGVLDAWNDWAPTYNGAVPNKFTIGSNPAHTNRFAGYIDEVAVYKEVFPAELANDTFTDSDSTQLESHTMDNGNGWVSFLDAFASGDPAQTIITSNQLQILTNNHGAVTDVNTLNYVVEADWVVAVAVDNRNSLLGRVLDGNDYIQLNVREPNADIQIVTRIDTVQTGVKNVSFTWTEGQTYQLHMICCGNRVVGMIDGQVIISADVTDLDLGKSGTKVGFLRNTGSSSSRFDNFKVHRCEQALLKNYSSVGTTAPNGGWAAAPNGSTFIWDIVDSGTSAPAGSVKLQQLIYMAVATPCTFTGVVDDTSNIYLDGVQIGSLNGAGSESSFNYTIPAGVHRILIHATNNAVGPAGVAMSVKRTSDNKLFLLTDDNWTYTDASGF